MLTILYLFPQAFYISNISFDILMLPLFWVQVCIISYHIVYGLYFFIGYFENIFHVWLWLCHFIHTPFPLHIKTIPFKLWLCGNETFIHHIVLYLLGYGLFLWVHITVLNNIQIFKEQAFLINETLENLVHEMILDVDNFEQKLYYIMLFCLFPDNCEIFLEGMGNLRPAVLEIQWEILIARVQQSVDLLQCYLADSI